ncbi:hypothetical protein ACFXDJ_19050 [Streptomyces sp. NPDC059443]|uniref:hypothetical protein n=1 Tax=unclassified Streptomyces TaxID=2593676 RepID=UPI0036CB7F24
MNAGESVRRHAGSEGCEVEEFLALSSHLTGFGPDELREGGLASELLAVVLDQIGTETYRRLAAAPDAPDEELVAAAEALTLLWYTGNRPGPAGGGGPFVVSPRTYAGALVWRAIGGHAPGTSAPGFGSWAAPADVRDARPGRQR